jgi:hypothetical protein
MKGILFDKIKEVDVDHDPNNPKKEGKALNSDEMRRMALPFHDDDNDDQPDRELLFDYDPDGLELAPSSATIVVKDGDRRKAIQNRQRRKDPSIMARRLALRSGHQTGYKESPQRDFVDQHVAERREKRALEAQKENQRLEASGAAWPDAWKDRPKRTTALNRDDRARGIGKPVPFFLKCIAARLGVDPEAIRWPRYMNDLTNGEITQVVDAVKSKQREVVGDEEVLKANQYVAPTWNLVVPQLSPEEQYRRSMPVVELEFGSFVWENNPVQGSKLPKVLRKGPPVQIRQQMGSSMRTPTSSVPEWDKPHNRNPVDGPPGLIDYANCKDPMEFGVLMSEQWMEDVEAGKEVWVKNLKTGEQELLATHCAVTGESLIRKKVTGYKHWVLSPTLWGMSIRTARVVVTATAVEAGLYEGEGNQINYPEDEEVKERLVTAIQGLKANPDIWCVIAIATGHKKWAEVAKVLTSIRDRVYHHMPSTYFDKPGDVGDGPTVESNQRELNQLAKKLMPFK